MLDPTNCNWREEELPVPEPEKTTPAQWAERMRKVCDAFGASASTSYGVGAVFAKAAEEAELSLDMNKDRRS